MNRNEQGLTLIEVLAATTILSFIGIIIWGVFFQGFHFSQNSMKESKMQQEARLIVTSLIKFHQTTKETYEIDVSDCSITVYNSSDSKKFEHPQLCLSSNYSGITPVDPDKEDIYFTLQVTDKNNSNKKVSIETVLYRLKSGD